MSVEIFDTLLEVQVLVERWRNHYNTVRPHSALNCRPPAPEAVQPLGSRLRYPAPVALGCPGLNYEITTGTTNGGMPPSLGYV